MKKYIKAFDYSTTHDYDRLKGKPFKEALNYLFSQGFKESEYGDTKDGKGYNILQNGVEEVELIYDWIKNGPNSYSAGTVLDVYSSSYIQSSLYAEDELTEYEIIDNAFYDEDISTLNQYAKDGGYVYIIKSTMTDTNFYLYSEDASAVKADAKVFIDIVKSENDTLDDFDTAAAVNFLTDESSDFLGAFEDRSNNILYLWIEDIGLLKLNVIGKWRERF